MAVGIFNPKDTARTTATRPTHVNLAEGVRKWMSDTLKTRPKAQDWNSIIANFRAAATAFVVTDEETDTDNILTKSILSAVNDLTTGAVVTLASAATTNLGTARNSRIDISGNVSITSFGSTANKIRLVRTTGTPLITLPNGQSYQAAAGDAFLTVSDNAGAWRILSYWPAGDQLFGIARPTIASAATVDIGAQSAFVIEISGAASISSLGTVANRFKLLKTTGAVTFVHGANLTVPGAANYVSVAGDHILAASNNTGQWSILPLPSGGVAVSAAYVTSAVAAVVGGAPANLNTLDELAAAIGDDPAFAATMTAALAAKLDDSQASAFGLTLMAAANAAAGRTALALATVANTGSAADLTGTLAAARLPAALASVHPLTPAADLFAYFTGAATAALAAITAYTRTLLAQTNAAGWRSTLGLGTAAVANVGTGNGLDADLLDGQHGSYYRSAANLNAGELAAARLPVTLAALHPLIPGTWDILRFTSPTAAQAIPMSDFTTDLIWRESAVVWRVGLGLTIGVNVQAYSAALTDLASSYSAEANMSPLPTVEGSTLAGLGTYTVQLGRQRRIGNTIYFDLRLTWTAHTGTGNMQIKLPFVSAALGNHQWTVLVSSDNLDFNAQGFIASSSDIIILRKAEVGAAASIPMEPAGTIRISGHVEV